MGPDGASRYGAFPILLTPAAAPPPPRILTSPPKFRFASASAAGGAPRRRGMIREGSSRRPGHTPPAGCNTEYAIRRLHVRYDIVKIALGNRLRRYKSVSNLRPGAG